MSFLQLLKPAKRNLFQVLYHLPNKGVGAKVTRDSWAAFGDSYWEVTKVRFKDEAHGVAWGNMMWKGKPYYDKPVKIRGKAKKIWQWMPAEAEVAKYKPILEKIRTQEQKTASAPASAPAAETQQ